jgi:hypothetical protein
VAKEKERVDAERLPGFQERDYENLSDGLRQMQGTYARDIAIEVSTHFLMRLLKAEGGGENPPFVIALLGADLVAKPDADKIRAKMKAILDATTLEAPETRLKLFKEASYADLKASKDPLIQLAIAAEPTIHANEEHGKALSGEMLLVSPLYIEVLRDFLKNRQQVMAPDANSTLRVTFGQVGGYEKKEGDRLKRIPAFTNMRQLIELNFLANVDTTGGNSGSAALNAKGQLVGLLFDGNTDSLYGDYVFDAGVRSILLDVRYALWVLDEIEGMTEILNELGIEPTFAKK